MLTQQQASNIKDFMEEVVKRELEALRTSLMVTKARSDLSNYLFNLSNPSKNLTSNPEN